VEAESYLDLAITEWLPRRWEDPAREAALTALAHLFEEQHGDHWLGDEMGARRSDGAVRGLNVLAVAVKANRADGVDAAGTEAVDAAEALRKAGHFAAALFADQEQVYALHRNNKPRECVDLALRSEGLASRARYPWIEGQVLIELGICRGMQGDSSAGYRDLTRALSRIRASHYAQLEMRGQGILLGIQTNAGNLPAAWDQGREGLSKFWSGAYPGIRAQQFYVNMRRASDLLNLTETAYVFTRAQMLAIAETEHRQMEAIARVQLGALASETGRQDEALEQFDTAEQIFAHLKPSKPVLENRLFGEIFRAESDIARGDPKAGRNRLDAIDRQAQAVDSVTVRLRYYQTRGEALAAAGDAEQAEAARRSAVEISETRLAFLNSPMDRAAVVITAGKAYRGLAAGFWDRDSDHAQALGLWEWFRAAEWPSPRTKEVDINGLKRETIVSYAEFPDSIVVWAFDDRGIKGYRVDVGKAELETVARRFLRLCSDPASSGAALRDEGRRLYDWLIAPVEPQLQSDRTLVIEPDAATAAIPFGALQDRNQRYLGEKFAIVTSSGSADYLRRTARGGITSASRALVVANPALGGDMAREFPPLPHAQAESRSVASRFRSALVLEGRDATLENLEQHGAGVELLHFAGHGFSNSGNGGLLLAPNQDESLGADVLDGKRLAGQDWSKCRLAVLSACSAGTGETQGHVNPESLVRRLLWSGVARVVASRWNVDSQAGADLMDAFYAALANGSEVPAALRQAAGRLRGNESTHHPYYWAGFQTFGSR
jgi:CHAT domain-containing protein